MKQCSKCGEVKNESEFSPARSGGASTRSRCKSCMVEYSTHYYHGDAEHREKCKNSHSKTRAIPSTCKTIHKHHEEHKDDPDHLTTEFIQKFIGRKCKKDIGKFGGDDEEFIFADTAKKAEARQQIKEKKAEVVEKMTLKEKKAEKERIKNRKLGQIFLGEKSLKHYW